MARKYASEKMIKEFNDLATKINQQIDELERADSDSVTLEKWRGYFQPITTDQPDYRTVMSMLKTARSVYNSDQLSIEGVQRSKASALDTIRNELGLTYVNNRNFNSFMRFLDDARARGLGSIYSSEQLIEAIQKAKKKGLTPAEIRANMDRWAGRLSRDVDGKTIEIENPPELKVRHVRIRKGR